MTEMNPIDEALKNDELVYDQEPLQYILIEVKGSTAGADVGASVNVVGIDTRMAAHILRELAGELDAQADKEAKEQLEATGVTVSEEK